MVIHALQFLLMLALTAPLLVATPRNLLGFTLHCVIAALALVALGRVGLWTLFPWWTPHAFGVVLLAAVLLHFARRREFSSLSPRGAAAAIHLVVMLAVGAAAAQQLLLAHAGRTPVTDTPVELALPFATGTYLVVNGGSNAAVNAHLMTLDTSVPRYRPWRGQSYGLDLIRINAFGLRASGLLPANPAAYYSYNVPVLAPCSGTVVAAADGQPDMQVPDVDRVQLLGNHVIVRCGAADVVLAHLRPASVAVSVGASVQTGDVLGALGNSGNSQEPHLHIHAQTPGSSDLPVGGEPLEITIDGRFLPRNARVTPSLTARPAAAPEGRE